MQDMMNVFDEMKGGDFMKVIGGSAAGVGLIAALPIFGAIGTVTAGGVIIGSLLGAGAGVAVVANDEEERKTIQRKAEDEKEPQWAQSVAARQGLAESARSVDGYYQGVKLAFALVATRVAMKRMSRSTWKSNRS